MPAQPFVRVSLQVPPDQIEAVQQQLRQVGAQLLRHPFEGEQVGGWSEWQPNVLFALSIVEAPGAVFATVELVRRALGQHADAIEAMNIEEVNPEGRAIRRCSMCSTEFYFGQLDHVPAHCPNVGCDGKLGAELGFVGNDVVFPPSAPPPGTEFTPGRRDLFVSPPCPVCEGPTVADWEPVTGEVVGERWRLGFIHCTTAAKH